MEFHAFLWEYNVFMSRLFPAGLSGRNVTTMQFSCIYPSHFAQLLLHSRVSSLMKYGYFCLNFESISFWCGHFLSGGEKWGEFVHIWGTYWTVALNMEFSCLLNVGVGRWLHHALRWVTTRDAQCNDPEYFLF